MPNDAIVVCKLSIHLIMDCLELSYDTSCIGDLCPNKITSSVDHGISIVVSNNQYPAPWCSNGCNMWSVWTDHHYHDGHNLTRRHPWSNGLNNFQQQSAPLHKLTSGDIGRFVGYIGCNPSRSLLHSDLHATEVVSTSPVFPSSGGRYG